MLDVPAVGRDLLNRTIRRVAQNSEDSNQCEATIDILESCKALMEPHMSRALTATSQNSFDRIRREKDIVKAFVEAGEAKRCF